MTQYRLIQEYPGHSLGEIHTADKGTKWYGTIFYNANPKFWQKVEEVDYEILSFYSGHSDDKMAYIFKKTRNGLYSKGTGDCDLDHALKYWNIHSVKRLSDGEVFTIGDEYSNDAAGIYTKELIHHIDIVDNECRVYAVEDSGYYPIKYIDKIPKKTPLFATEDGVSIFKGDRFSVVQPNTFQILNECRYPLTAPAKWVCFSTEEKAKEYILLNKPCLSLNDFLSVFGSFAPDNESLELLKPSSLFKSFEKLAKSKL